MNDDDFWALFGLTKPTDEEMERYEASLKRPSPKQLLKMRQKANCIWVHESEFEAMGFDPNDPLNQCGCHLCGGTPPSVSDLVRALQNIQIPLMFGAVGYEQYYEQYRADFDKLNAHFRRQLHNASEASKKPRRKLIATRTGEKATRDDIIAAAHARAEACWPDEDPAMRGWKGVVAHAFDAEWRTLEPQLKQFDLSEEELIARMREWNPPPNPKP